MPTQEQSLSHTNHNDEGIIFTNDTDIRLGFEIECVIRSYRRNGNWGINVNWTKFCTAIRDLKKNITIGSDCSIRTDAFGSNAKAVEVRTRPLPPKDAMELLKAIFNIVNKYGSTNSSCGLHVNISSMTKTKMLNFNPIPFLSSKLWGQLLNAFDRTNNGFCRINVRNDTPQICKVRMFKQMTNAFEDKCRCVNLCRFGNGISKSSRVEIRGFGNTNYTKKLNTVAKFVKRIETLFTLSCDDSVPLTKTFNV